MGKFCYRLVVFSIFVFKKYALVFSSSISLLTEYSIILLYRSSGDRDEYFDISKFQYNRSSFVLTLCPAGLQIELRYKRNFDINEFDIAGFCCNAI